MANSHEAHDPHEHRPARDGHEPRSAPAPGDNDQNVDLDCGAALHELYRYLDGEMPHPDHQRLGQHLQDCVGCLSSFDFEQVLWRVVRLHLSAAQRVVAPPPTLATRITISMQIEARNLPDRNLPGAGPLQPNLLRPNLPEGGLNGPN
ncbi:MAG: zf-HC2 domain-containing protein [Acidimicrobiales bacterium]